MTSHRTARLLSLCVVLVLGVSWLPFACTAAPLRADDAAPPAAPVKLVFIHHSVGDDWLANERGALGAALGANNYYVSDTYYDWGPDSIGSATDIGNWWDWFRGPHSATYTQSLYHTTNRHADYTRPMADPGGENVVILLKSCFPNSHLGGAPDDPPTTGANPLRGESASSEYHTVGNAKGIYNDLLVAWAAHPDKLFVLITAPPLTVAETDATHAANARALNEWLVHDWLDGYAGNNVQVFDFYNVLTSNGGNRHTNDLGQEQGNHHRWWQGAVQHVRPVNANTSAYASASDDSHPTTAGLLKATGEFVSLLNVYYYRWAGGAPQATATLTPQGTLPPGTRYPLRLPFVLKGVSVVAHTPTATRTPAPATLTPTPTSSTSGCPAYAPGYHLVTDRLVHQPPPLPEPPPRQWWSEPTFGTCLVRVTDRAHDLAPEDSAPGMANEYARAQAFNADGSRFLVISTEYGWYLYDSATLQPLGALPLGVEARWHPTNPNLLHFIDETRLMRYDLASQQTTEVHDFRADLAGYTVAAVWTRYEGSPSGDGRWWALMAEDEQWLPAALIMYDLTLNQVRVRDIRQLPAAADDIDHVTTSPLGTYLLASFDRACEPGTLGSDGSPCGLMAYNRDLSAGRGLVRAIGHYDVALDAAGREVVVYQDVDTDQIAMVDLATGARTALLDIDFSHTSIGLHFSGQAFQRPGWAVVSTHDEDAASHTWMDDGVFLVALRAGGEVVRLAHTHSLTDPAQPYEYAYWAEPHASTNRELTRILFTSNWGRYNTGAVEVHMIALPNDWPSRLVARPD